MTAELPHGRSRYRHKGCRCEVRVESNRHYMGELRARKRGLAPVATEVIVGCDSRDLRVPVEPPAQPGPCVLAVRADVAAWGVGSEHALVAVAEAMARIFGSSE